jgi:hypothetical protein
MTCARLTRVDARLAFVTNKLMTYLIWERDKDGFPQVRLKSTDSPFCSVGQPVMSKIQTLRFRRPIDKDKDEYVPKPIAERHTGMLQDQLRR